MTDQPPATPPATPPAAPPAPLAPAATPAAAITGRPLRYYDFIMAAFVAVLILSNVIGASKLAQVGGYTFGAGILFFPVSYVLGDVLTEVYGYARARRVIWAGFAGLLFLAFMSWAVTAMPPAADWWCGGVETLQLKGAGGIGAGAMSNGAVCQATYDSVFGQVWRIVFASITAFWAGEFVNSYVLARMKLWTGGRMLWTRTIGSTIVGQGIDSLIFYPVAFYGAWSNTMLLTVMVTNWALKVFWEAALTPVTYLVVNTLKRREGMDIFDDSTDFSPFHAKV